MQRCVRMNVYSVCTGGWAGECGEGMGLRVQVPGAWALNHGPLEGTACVQVCVGWGGMPVVTGQLPLTEGAGEGLH